MRYRILVLLLASLSLSGCVTPIGQENFTCNAEEKGGVCNGPREIYELTNTRDSLEKSLASEHVVQEETIQAANKETTYIPRSMAQQTPGNYETARPADTRLRVKESQDSFTSWPSNGIPLAPEPLAVLKAPKVMRVLIAAWKDEDGNLNMPGYVYAQVEDETWNYGEAANIRPTRVIPLQIRQHSQQELRKRKERSKGVSPLEVITQQEE